MAWKSLDCIRGAHKKKRVKGFEPSTSTLATWCSTTELHPQVRLDDCRPTTSGIMRYRAVASTSLLKKMHRQE